MFEPIKIAPSILSADFMDLGAEIARIEEAGAGYVHVDVMDGHFVPNLSIGVPLLKQLVPATSLPCDVHLMIDNPLRELPWFLDCGAALYTIHREAVSDDEARQVIAMIHEAGALAALSVKPKTPVHSLEPVLEELDMVLVMSVEPGFSGQSYIEGSEDRVAELAQLCRKHGASPLIEVDGGIGEKTAARVAAAGADVLVCGNAFFKAEDPAFALKGIAAIADKARLEGLRQLGEADKAGVPCVGAPCADERSFAGESAR